MNKKHIAQREKILCEISEMDRMLIAILKGNLILENKLKDLLFKYGIEISIKEIY